MLFRDPFLLLLFLTTLASCSAKSTTPIVCRPVATPTNPVFLLNPAPGATGVPDDIETLTIGAMFPNELTKTQFAVTDVSGTTPMRVSSGLLGPPPSPLPSPLAATGPDDALSYFGLSVPVLSPATTYDVSFAESSGTPGCVFTDTLDLGSFTTK